ncbi:MAG TPA: GNAT family protein [Mycobacteriales bacterium]|nr:GNAT family protein [Mycobacteriales bacterium]
MSAPALALVELDPSTRDRALNGDLVGLHAAPGWPHRDTAPGLSFLDCGGRIFLIVDDAGRIVGECGTKGPPDALGTVEIGYGLAAQSRGRGLGTAAIGLLLDRLADDPEVHDVEAEVLHTNAASWRLLERLGFGEVADERRDYRRYRRPLRPARQPR